MTSPLRYARTLGIEGSFTSEAIGGDNNELFYMIELRGSLYNEVENAEIRLTTKAEDRPRDFQFKVIFCHLST